MGKGNMPRLWLGRRLEELMSQPLRESYTILAPGFAKWWGSDARALAQAFRRLGHRILDIDEEDYVPWRWQGIPSKVCAGYLGLSG